MNNIILYWFFHFLFLYDEYEYEYEFRVEKNSMNKTKYKIEKFSYLECSQFEKVSLKRKLP